jgi:hypothetical protein
MSARFIRAYDSAGRQYSLDELFDGYVCMDELVKQNIVRSGSARGGRLAHAEEAVLKILQQLQPALPADIRLEVERDGESKTLEAGYRTNFAPTVLKRPNVIYLKDGGATRHVLREARTYGYDETPLRRLSQKFGNKFNREGYRKSLEDRRLNFIPEPVLTEALEKLASQGAPRITPRIELLERSTGRLVSIRDFLQQLKDTAFDAGQVGEYLGTIHSYGIVECDRQEEHYAEQGGRLVNIDPDFSLWTSNRGHLESDAGEFLNIMRVIYPTMPESCERQIKEVRSATMAKNKELAAELGKASVDLFDGF